MIFQVSRPKDRHRSRARAHIFADLACRWLARRPRAVGGRALLGSLGCGVRAGQEVLQQVPDRRAKRGRRHPLTVVLVLTACATLVVGGDSITAIWRVERRTIRTAPPITPSSPVPPRSSGSAATVATWTATGQARKSPTASPACPPASRPHPPQPLREITLDHRKQDPLGAGRHLPRGQLPAQDRNRAPSDGHLPQPRHQHHPPRRTRQHRPRPPRPPQPPRRLRRLRHLINHHQTGQRGTTPGPCHHTDYEPRNYTGQTGRRPGRPVAFSFCSIQSRMAVVKVSTCS